MQATSKKLNDRARRAGGLWLLITVLLFLLIVGLNIYVWFRYCSQADELKYFETRSYDALLAALLIPMLLTAIANVFKVNEKFEADRQKREQEKRRGQIAVIAKTNAMWSELFNLSIEVAYFKAGHGATPVRELRKKLERIINTGDEMFSLWIQHFPNIPKEDLAMFLPGLNILMQAAASVADAIENEADAEVKPQQDCLLLIQDGIQSIQHLKMMDVFHLAMEPDKEKTLLEEINQLRPWFVYFQSLVKNYEPNLPQGAEAVDAFQTKRKTFQTSYDAYVKKAVADSPASSNLGYWDVIVIWLFQKCRAFFGIPNPNPAKPKLPAWVDDAFKLNQKYQELYGLEVPNRAVFEDYYHSFVAIPSSDLGLSRKKLYSSAQLTALAMELFRQQDVGKVRSGT